MQSDRRPSWPDRYRPCSPNELVGQHKAVTRIKALVQQPQHVVLTGETGVGKTTLSLSYAQALMCTTVYDGFACGSCDSCLNFKAGCHPSFHHKNSSDITPDWLRSVMAVTRSKPLVGRRNVFIFDEAGELPGFAREAILQPMEAAAERTFIFTLIDIGVLPEQLRARCQEIELAPATIVHKAEYIKRIAETEQLTISQEAAELISHFSSGYRGAARNLQGVSDSTPSRDITLDDVRSTILQDRSQRMLDVLAALASGEWPLVDAAMSGARLGAKGKHRALLEVLMYLKLKYVGPALADERRFDLLLSRGDCLRVLHLWDERAASHGISLLSLFDEVLEFLAFMPLSLDEELFRLQLIRLFDVVNIDRGNRIGREPTEWTLRDEQEFRSSAAIRAKPKFRSLARRDGTTEIHLSGTILEQLFEAATFLPQHYGCWFNWLVELHFPAAAGDPGYGAAGRFAKDLAAFLGRRGGHDSNGAPNFILHRIILLESGAGGSVVATVIFHLPEELLGSARDWLIQYRLRLMESRSVSAFYSNLSETVRGHARHWELVRQLLWGIDPSLYLDGEPAHQRLRISKARLRPAGTAPKGRRYNLSQSISPEVRRRQAQLGLGHLSAMQDSAWEWLFTGWEAGEYSERQRELQRRATKIRQLELEHSAAADALHRRALERLISDEQSSWIIDPHKRPRTKKLWW